MGKPLIVVRVAARFDVLWYRQDIEKEIVEIIEPPPKPYAVLA